MIHVPRRPVRKSEINTAIKRLSLLKGLVPSAERAFRSASLPPSRVIAAETAPFTRWRRAHLARLMRRRTRRMTRHERMTTHE